MQLLKELSRTSQDSFGLDSDSKESWDDWLNSFKSGVLYFFDSIDSIFISIRSILRPGVVVDRPGLVKGSAACQDLAETGEVNSDKKTQDLTRAVHYDPQTQYRSNRN